MNEDGSKLHLDDEHLDAIAKKVSAEGTPFTEVQGNIASNYPTPPNAGGSLPQASSPAQDIPSVQIKHLRTFQGDVAEIIKNQNTSVLSIALAEKKKKQEVEKTSPPKVVDERTKKNISTVLASILLIILGIGAVAGFYFIQKNAPKNTPAPESRVEAILPYSSKVAIDVSSLSKDRLIKAVAEAGRGAVLSQGEILFISLLENNKEDAEKISTKKLFSILEASVPGGALRSFEDGFMLGFLGNSKIPFLLIRLSSFDNAFDGMLRWESTLNADIGSMLANLQIIPSASTVPVTDSSVEASSSTLPKVTFIPVSRGIPNKEFKDETIKNKDARILEDSLGNTLLLYSFLDRDTLLITISEGVLEELSSKLNALKLIR
jgi:hypothetical protein